MDILSRTKVHRLTIAFDEASFLHNGGMRVATALERCTCITELTLKFPSINDRMELIQILFLESIPKMLGLKKLELEINGRVDGAYPKKIEGDPVRRYSSKIAANCRAVGRCSRV
jgi:hypothetical protein